jgi:ribosomal protein L10
MEIRKPSHKYTGINLTKEAKDLCMDNNKASVKEIDDDTKKSKSAVFMDYKNVSC